MSIVYRRLAFFVGNVDERENQLLKSELYQLIRLVYLKLISAYHSIKGKEWQLMYHVVVAEDEHWIRSGIVKMLERISSGFTVVGEAEDGAEAWQLIQELSPNVLITDIEMPHKDGLALLKEIHEQQLPVISIILSSYDKFEYAQQGIRYGVSEYLLKPVREEVLKESLQRSIDRLEMLKPIHEQMLKINAFLERLPLMDEQQVQQEQSKIVQAIMSSRHSHPSSKIGLLRIFTVKWNELLKVYYPEDISIASETNEAGEAAGHADAAAYKQQIQQLADRWCGKSQSGQTKRSYRLAIKQACSYAETSYMHEIRMNSVAEHVGLSVSHFSALFKQHTGETFGNYVNLIRIEKAKQLLLEPDLKAYEVAELVGFTSAPYFTRLFKNTTGLSPNEYRKRLGLL